MSRSIAHTRTTKSKPASQLTHRLHTLLHTVRSIAQVEDELCALLHEVERTGTLTPEATAELQALLNKLPTQEYAEDLEAVRSFMTITAPIPKSYVRKVIKVQTKPKSRKAKS